MRVRLLKGISRRLRSASGLLMLGLLMALANPGIGVSGEIAYYSHREGEWSWYIHIINTNGSEPIRLAEGGTPAWSPDGTTIAFWSNREGQPDIYVMDADGMNPTNLTRDPHDEDRPSWSPDGSKIAFGALLLPRGEKSLSDIFVMDADGGNRINLTQNPEAVNQFPAWSPDGSRIAYEASPHPNHWFPPSNIHVMNADGSQPEMLTAGRRFASEGLPTWSPYERRIAYHRREPDGKNDIFAINADSTGLLNLTKTEFVEELSPSWRPAPLAVSRRGRLATQWGAVKLRR